MKLKAPKNQNYAATVARVRQINKLDKCDNVVGLPLLGYQAITGKDVQEGDLGILFGAETQLSSFYASKNNLHRHADLNNDPNKVGYLEDNRRVKALRFRGHRSDALFMPLSSLTGFTDEWDQLKEGDTFDEINGFEICRKYEVYRKPDYARLKEASSPKRLSRVDELLFPKHFDTPNYFRTTGSIKDEDHVIITQKLHGTSVRIGHIPVKRKLSWIERLARKFGARVQETEYAYVYGSRNVVKDPGNPTGGFYGKDLYSEVGSRLKGLLPKGYVVYGEIVGWVPGTSEPIQSGYTYCIPQGEARLYVYRITTINEEGRSVDLSWEAVKEFCRSIGVSTVPQVDRVGGAIIEDYVPFMLDVRLAERSNAALPTDDNKVDEGVCLRVEGLTPTIVKAKSPEFLRFESKQLDKGTVDIESAEEVAA